MSENMTKKMTLKERLAARKAEGEAGNLGNLGKSGEGSKQSAAEGANAHEHSKPGVITQSIDSQQNVHEHPQVVSQPIQDDKELASLRDRVNTLEEANTGLMKALADNDKFLQEKVDYINTLEKETVPLLKSLEERINLLEGKDKGESDGIEA